MNYKKDLDPSYFSNGFLEDDSDNTERKLFDKNYIINIIENILSFDSSQINQLLIILNKYFLDHPTKTVEILIENNFFQIIFQQLINGFAEYTNSILLLLYNFFLEAPSDVLEDFLISNNAIINLMNILQQSIHNHQIFTSILLTFIPILNKFPNFLEIFKENDIWDLITKFEKPEGEFYFNNALQSKKYIEYINDSSLFQKAHNEMKEIEEEEERDKEEYNKIPDLDQLNSKPRTEFELAIYYQFQKQKEIERMDKIQKREEKKQELAEVFYLEQEIKYRTILFNFICELIKVDYDSYPYYILDDDLFNLLSRNFFKKQLPSVLCSIMEIFEFISRKDFPLFQRNFEKYSYQIKRKFLKINIYENKSINQNSILILSRFIENDFDFFNEIINKDTPYNTLSTCFQRALVYTKPDFQNKEDTILVLRIIQDIFIKASSSSSMIQFFFNEFLEKSGILNQICNLMNKSSYDISSEALKTFFISVNSLSDFEYIELLQKYPIIEKCSSYFDSDEQENIIFALNIILRMIKILNIQNSYEHFFFSLQDNCDFQELAEMSEDENEEIAQLASSIINEIDFWQKNHN